MFTFVLKAENMSKISIVGIGPGDESSITPEALAALQQCDVVVGYKYYFQFIKNLVKEGTELIDTGMKQERARAEMTLTLARQGKNVAIISSGDAGIYGMAPLVWEMSIRNPETEVEIEVVPGISAFQKAAALLGAPMGHDFCVISLSDLLTPWSVIEKRILAAADADFVTAIYNPKSKGRYWQLHRLKEIFLKTRSKDTPVGYVRQAGREEQKITVTTLGDFNPEEVDMFTVVIIGNSRTFSFGDHIITPRGYYQENNEEDLKIGQAIMTESFRTIERELSNPNLPIDTKWALLHAIHTTADFDMENALEVDDEALKRIYQSLTEGNVRTIVTDVTMAASGIRKGALERLGIEVKCYLHDPRVKDIAEKYGITRTQAGIRLAVQEHPDALYVFGNAPTALMELAHLMRTGEANPCGVVAAPVGFVHVCESKHMIKSFGKTPKLIIRGRKGGSNLAATLTNAILCYPDAQQLKPGRDV